MRSRLVAAFMMVTLVSMVGAGLVRTLTISGQLEEQELAHLHRDAQVALAQISQARADDRRVTSALLESFVTDETRLQYVAPDGRLLQASGSDYATSVAAEGSLTAQVFGADGTVVASQSRRPLEAVYRRDLPAVLTLLTALTLLAGLAGSLAARRLASPFLRLAAAANTLGRGRSDLDLPRSRVVEAETIGTALRGAAGRLEAQRRQEHALAERASHVLRTPLTGITLTLDELDARDDLPHGVREAVQSSRVQAQVIGTEVEGLVASLRAGVPGADMTLPLRVVAEEVVARWAERLPVRRRMSGSVEGDLDLPCAPGPLEHALDLLLDEVARHGRDAVRLEITGRAEHVLVTLSAGAFGDADPESLAGVVASRELVSALGGRMACTGADAPLEIRLPAR